MVQTPLPKQWHLTPFSLRDWPVKQIVEKENSNYSGETCTLQRNQVIEATYMPLKCGDKNNTTSQSSTKHKRSNYEKNVRES